MPKFEVIEEPNEELAPRNIPSDALNTILMGLKALPQRAAFAISNCFTLLTVASVFWLAMLIIPYTPNAFQLSGLAGYALFILAVNVITRNKQ